MKKNILTTLALMMIFLMQSQSINVTVNNGYGSGTYNKGDTIHIWSRTLTKDTLFDNWTGDVQFLQTNDEWHSFMVIPTRFTKKSINLTANYLPFPKNTKLGTVTFNLKAEDKNHKIQNKIKTVWYHTPAKPKGVVILFHGTGGSGEKFYTQFEKNQLVKDLINAGYATIATDCNERTMQLVSMPDVRWNAKKGNTASINNNVDLLNIALLKDSILEKFKLNKTTPFFSFGMSNGAVFGDLCAAVLNFEAHVHNTSNGNDPVYLRKDLKPTLWVMSENDHQKNADRKKARKHFDTLKTFQDAEWIDFRRSPFYKERLMRGYSNITRKQSITAISIMKKDGYILNNGFLKYPVLDSFSLSYFKNMGFNNGQAKDIKAQLKCVNADHTQHADYNKTMIRFYDKYYQKVGLEKVTQENDLWVYPNPVSDILYFGLDYGIKHISIFDMCGKVVLKTEFLANNLNISNLKSGVYLLKVMIGNKMYNSKFIKK